MEFFHHYPFLLLAHAKLLVVYLAAGLLLGDSILRDPIDALLARGSDLIARFGQKLNRPQRGIATLVYRGLIALVMLLIPAMIVGISLDSRAGWVQLLQAILLVFWFGCCLKPYTLLGTLRAAKHGTLKLELRGLPYLFADSHAVLRFLIARHAERFATGVVGGSLAYLLGGTGLMLPYLMANAAHGVFHGPAFGWAARALCRLLNALPRMLALLLFGLAAFFTPGTQPLTALGAKHWRGYVAALIDGSLGGPSPLGDAPWVGTGTAKLTSTHLQRFTQLLLVASLLLILLYAAPQIINMLTTVDNKMIVSAMH